MFTSVVIFLKPGVMDLPKSSTVAPSSRESPYSPLIVSAAPQTSLRLGGIEGFPNTVSGGRDEAPIPRFLGFPKVSPRSLKFST